MMRLILFIFLFLFFNFEVQASSFHNQEQSGRGSVCRGVFRSIFSGIFFKKENQRSRKNQEDWTLREWKKYARKTKQEDWTTEELEQYAQKWEEEADRQERAAGFAEANKRERAEERQYLKTLARKKRR